MTESIEIGVQKRQLPLTGLDSIETEKPDWLTQMETVLELLNEGVVIADDSHRILFANSRLVEMTGIPPQVDWRIQEIRTRRRSSRGLSTFGRLIFLLFCPLFVNCLCAWAARGDQAKTASGEVGGSVFVRDSAGNHHRASWHIYGRGCFPRLRGSGDSACRQG